MTQRYCEACGNLFEATTTGGASPDGTYLCPSCAIKKGSDDSEVSTGGSPSPSGDMMSKGAGLKKSVETQAPGKLTFRCPNCNALLSSRHIEKRSRLTCPKCSEKVIINPDGSAELLAKRTPHMKKMDVPQKKKAFSDQDLERLLDFGETQPIGRDSSKPAPKPKAPPPPTPAPAAKAKEPDDYSGPQYLSDEDEERKKFLDQVQGPGGKKPTTGPKTFDAEIPGTAKKIPTTRKKLTKFGTDRRKTESVEDRLEAAKTKRTATRNKILAVIFIVLPLLVGVIFYYNASKPAEEGKEQSGLAKLVKNIGIKARLGALAINEQVLRQKPLVREEEKQELQEQEKPSDEQPGQPEEPVEKVPVKPAEKVPEKPVEEPKKPVDETKKPEKPAEQPKKPEDETTPQENPVKKPEESEGETKEPEQPATQPVKPADESKTPDKPASETAPKKPLVQTIKCPNPSCGRMILKTETKCPWCGQEIPQPPAEKENPDKDDTPRNN